MLIRTHRRRSRYVALLLIREFVHDACVHIKYTCAVQNQCGTMTMMMMATTKKPDFYRNLSVVFNWANDLSKMVASVCVCAFVRSMCWSFAKCTVRRCTMQA